MAEITESDRKRKVENAFPREEFNKAIIQKTLEECATQEKLFGPPPRAHLCLLPSQQHRDASAEKCEQPLSVRVHEGDSVALAQKLTKEQPSAKVWLLNMTCSMTPGGGARSGINAQEEHLCRCSNLLPQLESAAKYYPLRQRHYDGIDMKVLVHERVVFFKNPSDYGKLDMQDWFRAGVLTASAENVSQTDETIDPNADRFIDFLLNVVQMQECTHIILSTWGCGALGQSADAVARTFKRALARFDARTFPQVFFAVIDDQWKSTRTPGNLHAFRSVFVEK